MKRIKTSILLLLSTVLVVTCINPVYPQEQFLQHAGTLLLALLMMADIRKSYFSLCTFCGIAFFTLIHIIGARYIYSYVPYNEFILSLTGFNINEYFEATRNHFDRFVHFSFGLVMLPLFVETAEKMKIQSRAGSILVGWLIVQTGSMIYELFEWMLTIVMTSEAADYYNGQQGDMWDAQKDMALALAGSTITALIMLLLHKPCKKQAKE